MGSVPAWVWPDAGMLGWPGWLGDGFVIFLVTATVLTEPVRIYWWWRCRRPPSSEHQPQSQERRLFLRSNPTWCC